jgi:hypothetical protein
MRYPRALIADMGWVVPLAIAALCMLVFFAASVVARVDGGPAGKLPSVEAEVTAVSLADERRGGAAGRARTAPTPPDGGAPLPVPARPTSPSAPGGDGGGLSP